MGEGVKKFLKMVGKKWGNLTKMREFFKKIDLATLAGAEGKSLSLQNFWSLLRSALQKIWSEFRSGQTLIGLT